MKMDKEGRPPASIAAWRSLHARDAMERRYPAVVALIDMTAMAGLVGGGGLGAFAQIYGFRQFEPVVMWAAIVLIVVFVHLVQLLGTKLARVIMRR